MSEQDPPDFPTWWTQHCIELKNQGFDIQAYYARFILRGSLEQAYEAGMRKAYANSEGNPLHDDM